MKGEKGLKGEKVMKGNTKCAARPLLYQTPVNKELLSWNLIMNDFHLPESVVTLQRNTRSLILPRNPSFETSKGWICQFK